MKLKTSELDGAVLDWAVAKADGQEIVYGDDGFYLPSSYFKDGDAYEPSTDWAQGGEIIERELIGVRFICEGKWESWWSGWPKSFHVVYGPTPLIAAMRCYVAVKLGDEIEVPEEVLDATP